MDGKVKESQELLESALDSIRDPIKIVDAEYNILFVNQAAADEVGKSRRELIGKKCHKEYHDCDEPPEYCLIAKTIAAKQAQQTSRCSDTPDGTQSTWWEHTTFPIFDEAGSVLRVIEIVKDITSQQDLEEEKKRHSLQLGSMVRDLRQAYRKLQELQAEVLQTEKMASAGLVASSLSHQVSSPLSAISNLVDLLSEEKLEEKPRRWLEQVREAVHSCHGIVRGFLEFSRKATGERTDVDINVAIQECLALAGHVFSSREIDIHTELCEDSLIVRADKNQLEQVFLNIMNNAVEATHKGGTLVIRTRPNAGGVVAEFADCGVGIEQEDMEKIFEPFYTTKESGQGTGLGLSICHRIVEAHGGKIRVESTPGEGTTVEVTLPASQGAGGDSKDVKILG